MDFKEAINNLYSNLSELISTYESLFEQNQINNDFFLELKTMFDYLHKEAISTIGIIYNQESNSKEKYNRITEEYKICIEKINKQFEDKLLQINKNFEQELHTIDDNIEKEKKEYDKEKNTIDLDIEFDKQSIEQYIEMFENEYSESTNRYSYLYSIAKESYNNNILHYNKMLDSELNKLKKNHKVLLADFDKDTAHIIEKYNLRNSNNNSLLEQINTEYTELMSEIKEHKKNETKALNDSIRSLVNEKNIKIDKARAEYSSSQNNSNIEKENKKKSYVDESKRIVKEFMSKATELDEKNNKAKINFEHDITTTKEAQLENSFNLHIEQEKKMAELLKDNSYNEIKSIIKKINKEYYKIQLSEKNKTNQAIEVINNTYSNEFENISCDKKILDLKRSSEIEKLTEKEIRDNKYYQEINNSFENKMNYDIQTENHLFTIEANKIRLSSSINNLMIEKRIDELDAEHQKKTETIITNSDKNSIEINVLRKINELLHKNEIEKYQRSINYHTVSNLLEIEKCKVLDIYNKKQYELNVLNSKLILDYSIKKVQISSERFENENKKKLEISNKELNNNIFFLEINKLKKEIDKKYNLHLIENENKYLSSKTLYDFLYKRYQIELKNINTSFSVLIMLTKLIEKYTNNLFYKVNKIANESETFIIIIKFINSYINIYNSFYFTILNEYKGYIHLLIDNRLEFESEYKYKKDFSILDKNYTSGLSLLNDGKKDLLERKENKINRVEELRTLIFRLESSLSFKRYKNDREKYKEIKQNIKNYYQEIKILNKDIDELNKNITDIDEQIFQFETKYQKDLNRLKNLQFINALPYHKLKDSINSLISSIINNSLKANDNFNPTSYEFFFNYLKNMLFEIVNKNQDNNKKIYYVIKRFTTEATDNNKLELDNIEIDNYNSKIEIEKKYKKENEKINNHLIKETRVKNEELLNIKGEYLQLIKNYDKLAKDNELTYQNNVNQLLLDKKDSTNQFYIELYAICDNKKDIENDFEDFIKNADDSFEKEKNKILTEAHLEKKKIDDNLTDYIKKRNDLIDHLPIAVKLQTKTLIEENKNKNKEIESNISVLTNKYNSNEREIKKNINLIEYAYQTKLVKIKNEYSIKEKTIKLGIKKKKSFDAIQYN